MSDVSAADTATTGFDPKAIAKQLGLTIGGDHAGDITALAKRALDTQAASDKKITPMLEEQEKTLRKGEATSDAAFKEIPPFKPTPAPDQRQYQSDPLQSFFSLGSVVGILANAFEHQPWSNSFEAAAAAIDARNRGDAEAYKNAFEQWKANTDMLFKRHQVALQDWQALNEKTKGDMAARDALIRAWQAKYGADTDAALRAAGLYQQADEAITRKNTTILQMQEAYPKIVEGGMMTGAMLNLNAAIKSGDPKQIKERADELKELQGIVSPQIAMAYQRLVASSLGAPQTLTMKDGKQVNAQQDKAGVLGTPGAWYSADEKRSPIDSSQIESIIPASQSLPPQSPSQREANAAAIATGEPASQIIPGWGGAANRARLNARDDAINLIMKQNPGMTAAQAGVLLAQRSVSYIAGKASVTQLNTMLGATRQAVSQLEFNVGKAKEEMNKVGSTNLSPILNAIARGEERWTGDPAYSSLFFYMYGVAAESARILSGGQASRAQLHQGAMEEAQKWASINLTPAMFNDVATSMISEGENRIDNFEKAIGAQQVGGGTQITPPTSSPSGSDPLGLR